AVSTDDARADAVQFRPFLVGEEFLVGILGGSLQGNLVIVGPDALQVRFAPGGFCCRTRRLGLPRGRLARRALARNGARRHLQEHDHERDDSGEADHFRKSLAHLMPFLLDGFQRRDAVTKCTLSYTSDRSMSRNPRLSPVLS